MKSLIAFLTLFLLPLTASAQWQPTGATTGPIYYNGGNVGIGTATPTAPLHVVGTSLFTSPVTIGKQIIGMPWTNVSAPPAGYIKLVTPIVATESNMFHIAIRGYLNQPGQPFEIRCAGYAYTVSGLISNSCMTSGISLPVVIASEVRTGGANVVVIRIGTPTTSWYYTHFTAEYVGWNAKNASDFVWALGETTPALTGNTNNVIEDDAGGTLAVGATGTAAATTKLTVNGATQMNGNASVTGDLVVTGTVSGARVFNATYQDIAEWVPATEDMLPGTVVVLNPDKANQVMPSSRPYDTMVAGVVSAQPGVVLGVSDAAKEQIATMGRVKVRVDATAGAIRIGDILVTGSKPGTAMKSQPVNVSGIAMHRPGTVVGKALENLPSGEGEILVLLSLQ
ncbi:MAG: hypothetical protein QOH21_2083 [Acidobacteriota bacterium]|nr:hypothetical protein [Acidobacteriota bacterium]